MAWTALVDEVQGEPAIFYEFVVKQIQHRQIPDVSFSMANEFGKKVTKKWTGADIAKEAAKAYVTGGLSLLFRGDKREKWPSLAIEDRFSRAVVCAYQYGNSFHVSVRNFWKDRKMAGKEREGRLAYGDEVISGCFDESIERAVQQALYDYLGSLEVQEIPEEMKRKRTEYQRSSHVMEE